MQNPIQKFVWKTENFDEPQVLQSLIFFVESLHIFPNQQCLQNGGARQFFNFSDKLPGFSEIK